MKQRRIRGGRRIFRAAALALALALPLGALAGCAWWDKNVGRKVGNFMTRRLLIVTDPPDADVYVNNVLQGQTPLTLTYKVGVGDFMKGFVVVVQKEGYLPLRREVDYKTESIQLRLIRQQPQK